MVRTYHGAAAFPARRSARRDTAAKGWPMRAAVDRGRGGGDRVRGRVADSRSGGKPWPCCRGAWASRGRCSRRSTTASLFEREVFTGLDRSQIERARADWPTCYATELAPLFGVAAEDGGIVIDSRVFGQRQRGRMRYYNEVIKAPRVHHMMWMELRRRGQFCAVLAFTRTGSVFPDARRRSPALAPARARARRRRRPETPAAGARRGHPARRPSRGSPRGSGRSSTCSRSATPTPRSRSGSAPRRTPCATSSTASSRRWA